MSNEQKTRHEQFKLRSNTKEILPTMKVQALSIILASFFAYILGKYNNYKDKGKEFKYLLDPLVLAEVHARRGHLVILPCVLRFIPAHYRVKWTKVEDSHLGVENIILIANGQAVKRYGSLGPRASLRRAHQLDVSLRLTNLQLEDDGRYRCQLINGIEDESVIVTLRIEGVVFPYQSKNGRYRFTFFEAKEACAEQDAILATYKQLYYAWTEGLDWCNAGWLSDGTAGYPILQPRPTCGGGLLSGVRSYGARHKTQDHYDAFCFTSTIKGPLSFSEAEDACRQEDAELTRTGQLYSAWKFEQLDRCDGGWLKDGSVRFPIVHPREPCGWTVKPGVHSFGFPNKILRRYGAYCYQ